MTADFFQLIGSLFRILKSYSSNTLAGPQHREIRKEIYRQCELGCGPQHREIRKEILQVCMLVGQRNKF